MRPSDLPLRTKVMMILGFVVAMGAWSWLVSTAVYEWIPSSIAAMLGALLLGLAAGFVLGEWSARREILRRDAALRDVPEVEHLPPTRLPPRIK